MQLFHTPPVASAVFDEPNLVSAAGLVPLMALARRAGLAELADRWLSVPTDKGANAGVKIASLVAGMAAGVDSIDDMAVLRHGPSAGRRAGALDVGVVLAGDDVRSRSSARCGRVPVPGEPGC